LIRTLKNFFRDYGSLIKMVLILIVGTVIGYRIYTLTLQAEQTFQKAEMSVRRNITQSESTDVQNSYRVKPLMNQQYTPELIDRIQQADTSIKIIMFVIKPSEYQKNSDMGVRWILTQLKHAMERGVSVRLLAGKNEGVNPLGSTRHNQIIDRLDHPNFQGYVYPRQKSLHAKMVLIDQRVAIVGAHNWTWHSLRRSHETSLLMEGRRRLRTLHQRFDQLFKESKKFYRERVNS